MPRRNRLHLFHHVFDWIPWDRGFTAREIADALYSDRGGAHPSQVERVDELLREYCVKGYVEPYQAWSLMLCRSQRAARSEQDEPAEECIGSKLQRHALTPLTAEDLAVLPRLRAAVAELQHTLPKLSGVADHGELR